jgi:M6 family metalloprotease-like protein
MKPIARPFNSVLFAWIWVPLLLLAMGLRTQPATVVTLGNARFDGLTRIVVKTNVALTGITAAQIVITKPDGTVVPPSRIAEVKASEGTLLVVISADPFARISSQGTTIATRAFSTFRASRAVKIQRSGEPALNGHIIGASQWTDEGWSTSRTAPAHYDPITRQTGLYRFTDLTPNMDEKQIPLEWKDGNVVTPAHRSKNMLVLFVEFPDRRASAAGDPFTTFQPYLDFFQGAVDWFQTSSYGQFRLTLTSPQNANQWGWITMSKDAGQYKWDAQTHNMFAYVREACQLAYNNWSIKADDYDMLLIVPARGKSGLFNGPGNINRDPTDGEQPNTNLTAYVDRENKPHFIDTAITAGNDMFRWGYRWVIHEAGHAFGLPDLYMYTPSLNGVKVGAFFYCGGWDMMGNIAGHSTDFLAWHKWKLRWIRDDQVDVVSQSSPNPTTLFISPVETPGGSKMVVIRTGVSTAYVAEFRTRLGVNALDNRGKYSGVLIYRIDASGWEAKGIRPTAQIISRLYYNAPAVGGPQNKTGVWRPIDSTVHGYDSPDCLWQPGDVFADPAMGVAISIGGITHYGSFDPSTSPYTADDVAAITVSKTISAPLFHNVVLSNALLQELTTLTFDTNMELQLRIPNANANNGGTYTYVREESVLSPGHLVIAKANGSVIPAAKITDVTVNPTGVQVTLAKGTFARAADASGATIATRPYYHFGAGAAVRLTISK